MNDGGFMSEEDIVTEYIEQARDREMVERPPHYRHGGMEAKDVISAFGDDMELPTSQGFYWGNAIKYILRWPYKHADRAGQVRDLEKAIQNIEFLLEEIDDGS